jgi:predicted TIM-barrel fold metal-dependent hydrolase
VLDRYPKVTFIGHAQTWWSNIDKKSDPGVMYPAGPVSSGGITDRLLSDYANIYGDLSAKSGLNSMLRDEAHARDFLTRHQNKLLFGSDCSDRQANGPDCLGSRIIAAIRRLSPDKSVERKLLYGNASNLLKIT